MKTFKGLSAVALLGAIITGCNHLEIQPKEESLQIQQINEITAYNGDASTKSVLANDRTSILWSPNDQIKVFYGSASAQFTSLNTEPEESTIFSSNTALVYGGTESSTSYIWAVYPYSTTSTHDKTSVSLTVPNSITAVAGSFANGSFPAIGRSKDTNIAFYNVCGGICFTVTNNNIQSVTLTGNNNEDIAGEVKVGFDENERPIITEVISGQKTITINGSFQVGKWYYIPMLPVNFSKGFTIRFSKPSGDGGTSHSVLEVTTPYEVRRSIFGQLENADDNLVYSAPVDNISFTYPLAFVDLSSTLQPQYSITPPSAVYNSLEWTSSDESIATVDQSGVITPVSCGVCTISVTTDNGKSDNCTVYISSPSVTTNDATKIGCVSAVLNASFAAPGIADYRLFKRFWYSKTENTVEGLISSGSTYSPYSLTVGDDDFSLKVSDLEPNTTYYYLAECYTYQYINNTNPQHTDYEGDINHYYGIVQSFTTSAIPTTLEDGLVDLGLSVKWAGTNVGANSPEELGDLYAWGEVSPKTSSNWYNYTWCTYSFNDGGEDGAWSSDTHITKYGSSYSNSNYVDEDGEYDNYFWVNDGKTVLDLEDDAARVEWRGTWRMPTKDECLELINNCIIEKVKYNNCDGFLFTCTKEGYTDKRLFFPMTSPNYSGDETYHNTGSKTFSGLFWSSSQYLPFPICAYALRTGGYPYNNLYLGPTLRISSYPVRPVK